MARLSQSPSADSLNSGSISHHTTITDGRRMSAPSTISLDSPLPPISSIPSTFTNWDVPTPNSTQDKQRPFKSKSKHNLAVFGAKLTSTAASVGVHTSKYKKGEKDSFIDANRESMFVETPDTLPHPHDTPSALMTGSSASTSGTTGSGLGGGNSGGSMLKSKVFKQSKSDLKTLRIKTDLGFQTARSSLNDRSPMVRGGSTKELDRIAAIGQIGSPVQSNEAGHGLNSHHHHHHLHHPHISFRKRDSPAAVLSSSASNSTLASEGTVYTFNQSNSSGLPSAVASLHSFKTVEEGTAFLTSSWTLLTLRIQPVFKRDEPLRIPIEDVNILVLMHFSAHHALAGSGLELLTKLDELLSTGLKSSNVIPHDHTLQALADSWLYFHGRTLIALEAIFLPLQLEFDALGQVFTNVQAAKDYWSPLQVAKSTSNKTCGTNRSNSRKLSIRGRVLKLYRDIAVIPQIREYEKQLDRSTPLPYEAVMQVMQCLATLSYLKLYDDKELAIDQLKARFQDHFLRNHRTSLEQKIIAKVAS